MNLLYIVLVHFICVHGSLSQTNNVDSNVLPEVNNSSALPVLVLGACHASVTLAALTNLIFARAPNPRRMPNLVVPLHYNVYLAHEPERGMSWGHVHILVSATSPAESIILHAKKLNLDKKTLVITDEATRRPVDVISMEYEAINEWYVIQLSSPLQKDGHYTLSVAFERQQASRDDGLLWYKYTSGNNTRWLVFTQFEPNRARDVFPCFDEPALKARFNISIATPPGKHVLSNMPLRSATEPVKELPGWVWSHFEETVPMATYLVAFAITDFVQVKSETPSYFSVWVPKGMEQHVQFVANIGPDIVAAMEKLTGVKYKLPKLDNVLMIGSESQDYSGLENWGIIYYSNDVLSIDQKKSHARDIQNTLDLVAHEVAHMWFGNLVTPAWWDQLWLKEGFANYYAILAVSQVLDDHHADEVFVINSLHPTFQEDFGRTSMHQEASNTQEIERKYSSNSYSKGAVIIRMVEHILTTNVFRAGLKQYLEDYSYQAADANDLFGVLEAAADNTPSVSLPEVGLTVVMNSWVTQGGFPLITVTRNYDNGSATVCQQVHPSALFAHSNYSWWVPLSYTTQNEADFINTTPRLWLPANQSCVVITGLPGNDQWIIFNIKQTGYYRVQYDNHNWQLLANFLNSDQYATIHTVNRAQLLDDANNLKNFGLLKSELFQNLTQYLYRETDPTPWVASFLKKSPCTEKENSALLEKALSVRKEMENTIEGQRTLHLWYTVAERACAGYCAPSSCRENAYEQFKVFQDNPIINRIDPNKRFGILCGAMEDERSTEDDINFLWEMGRNATIRGEREDIQDVMLYCTINPTLMYRILLLLSTGDNQWLGSYVPSLIVSAACNGNNGISLLMTILEDWNPSYKPVVAPLIEKLTTFIYKFSGPNETAGKVWCQMLALWFSRTVGM